MVTCFCRHHYLSTKMSEPTAMSFENKGRVIDNQPQSFPGGMVGYTARAPPGLEYLAVQNKVHIYQVLHLVEVLVGWERNNQYRICNTEQQEFLHAREDTDCLVRQCLGTIRPFTIDITDMQGQVVIQLTRGLRCQGCCCPCCLQEMEIFSPPGNKIATVREIWTCVTPRYEVLNTQDELLYRIEGECCYIKCCVDIPFKIFAPDGSSAGEITKHWAGCRECVGQANEFSITYAPNEDPFRKAILLGTAFLVDYMYFERNNN